MPRLARTVFADVPHHITQRGNRREDVFFSEEDRYQYLEWLGDYCQRFNVEILAYCLMTNHIHLVLVPSTIKGLHQVLRPLHMRYTQLLNKQRGWKGHVKWEKKMFKKLLAVFFFSFTLTVYAETELTVPASQVTGVKIHTSTHSITSTRKYALLKIENFSPDCNKGVFIEAEQNKETYSTILTAIASNKALSISYLIGPAPWGDTGYCSLSSIEINN